jgi:two-component sensor histidine kinase/PAS domain-containing protein
MTNENRDPDERKSSALLRAELNSLRQECENLKTLLENAPGLIVMLDKDINTLYANVHPAGPYTYVPPERQPEIRNILEKVLETGEPVCYETEYTRPDGETVYYETHVARGIGNNHPPVLFSFSRDITKRKKIKESLTRLESIYRALFDHMASGVAVYEAVDNGEDFVFKDFNKAGERIDHISKEALIGRRARDAFPGIENLGLFKILRRVWKTGKPESQSASLYEDDRTGKVWRENYVYKLPTGEIVAVYNDVTERVRGEKALEESEAKKEALLRSHPDIILLLKKNGLFLDCFVKDESDLLMEPSKFIGRYMRDVFPPDLNLAFTDLFKKVDETDHIQKYEYALPINGKLLHYEARAIGSGEDEIMVVVRNITERIEAEEKIKRSLNEKQILLQEIHHRVKNNMAVISSMLNLQADAFTDPAVVNAFRDSRHRIRSMALVHEKLYRAEDLSRVDFSDYIHALVDDIAKSAESLNSGITMEVEAGDIFLGIDMAIPCGLVINELLINALKYAFPPGSPGKLRISMRKTANDKEPCYQLVISDNGTGLPDNIDIKNPSTFGLQLVDLLTQQLNGQIIVNRNNGTTFTINFPTG